MINHPYTREKHERLREAVKKFQEVSRPWNRPLASGLNYLGTIPPAVISVFFFRKLLEKANLKEEKELRKLKSRSRKSSKEA